MAEKQTRFEVLLRVVVYAKDVGEAISAAGYTACADSGYEKDTVAHDYAGEIKSASAESLDDTRTLAEPYWKKSMREEDERKAAAAAAAASSSEGR